MGFGAYKTLKLNNKEAFMKKAVLIGLVALLLASSLALVSCGGDSGGSSNAFVGTWVTSEFFINGAKYPATVKLTESDWTLTVQNAGINESGKYNPINNSQATLTQNGLYFGTAQIISSTTLRFNCTPGIGDFTK
jgi:hypothetical protein